MNSMRLKSLILLSFVFIVGCISKKLPIKREQKTITIKRTFYETKNDSAKPYIQVLSRVWYEDSFAIEEVCQFEISIRGSVSEQKTIVDRFRFNDLRNKRVCEYKHLSDTAILMRNYYLTDSVEMPSGWGFKKPGKFQYDSVVANSDTIIEKISYKRLQLSSTWGGVPTVLDCLFRCDIKESIFDMDPSLSKKVGCTFVKSFSFTKDKKYLTASKEIQIDTNPFDINVQLVFDKWKNFSIHLKN